MRHPASHVPFAHTPPSSQELLLFCAVHQCIPPLFRLLEPVRARAAPFGLVNRCNDLFSLSLTLSLSLSLVAVGPLVLGADGQHSHSHPGPDGQVQARRRCGRTGRGADSGTTPMWTLRTSGCIRVCYSTLPSLRSPLLQSSSVLFPFPLPCMAQSLQLAPVHCRSGVALSPKLGF